MHATIFNFVKSQTIINAYERNLQKYNGMTDRLTMVTHTFEFASKYWITKSDLENIIYLPFESLSVPAPSNYKNILSHIYGNYMEFPPHDKRGVWHDGIIEFDPDTPYNDYLRKRDTKQ